MQISFSINDVSIRPVIQSVIKECDLVFILADSRARDNQRVVT